MGCEVECFSLIDWRDHEVVEEVPLAFSLRSRV